MRTLALHASADVTRFFTEFRYLLKKAGKRPEGLSFDHIFRGNLRDGVHHPRNIEKIRVSRKFAQFASFALILVTKLKDVKRLWKSHVAIANRAKPYPKLSQSDNIHSARRPTDSNLSASPSGVFLCESLDDKPWILKKNIHRLSFLICKIE
jgi:hypothetical protein